jgi:hypothetical protein
MSTLKGGPNINTDGLVMCFDAINIKSYSGSSSWVDLSKNNYIGTLINNPTYDSNGCLVFNGVDQYLNLSTYSNDVIFNGLWLNGLSMECVIKMVDPLPSISDGRSIFLRSNGVAGSNYFNFSFQATRQLRFWIGNYVPAFTNTLLTPGVVYHAILTWDRSNVRFYINGVLDSTTPNSNNLSADSSSFLALGSASGAFPGWEFPGSIYYFRLYDRPLTQSEISQNFNATKTRFEL